MLYHLGETHSLLSTYIAELRDVNIQKNRANFRANLTRIGEIMAYEISKKMEYVPKQTQTPLGTATTYHLKEQPVLATILRAGLALHQGLMNFFVEADHAFLSAYRKHLDVENFEISLQYATHPKLDGRILIINDPMLATGASIAKTLEFLLPKNNIKEIHIAAVISSEEGIRHLHSKFPDVHIWTATIDKELNSRGYIIPGIGDVGDLAFGEKMQS